MSIAERVAELIAPAVEKAGFELVRVRMFGGTHTLQVMAERPSGEMNIDDCTQLSVLISELLDAADPIASEYTLEVSSPGIDRPLTREKDFIAAIGHEARFVLKEPLEGARQFKAEIQGLERGLVKAALKGAKVGTILNIPLPVIDEAKLVLTGKLIEETARRARPQAPTEELPRADLPAPARKEKPKRSKTR
ncbi:MAG: ribosome maturation factor RimP [Alphaproteobacteria bacterium]|nr:ribosome maturation factor RimP [Alphaproteobacteria bacterium]